MPVSSTDWHFLWLFTSSPQKIAGILGFFAVMFVVVLAFYFFRDNTGHDLNMKAIVDKMKVFQNRLAGRAYKDMTRSVYQVDKMRRWPFGRK